MERDCVRTRLLHQPKSFSRKKAKCGLQSLLIALIGWAMFTLTAAHAQQAKPTEDQVKAAYVFNFGKFVKWPPNSAVTRAGAFAICIFGDDPIGTVLESSLANQTLDGKPLAIRRLKKPRDAAGCRILYIGAGQGRKLPEILAVAKESSVLTVSDIPDFSKRGGMIEFVLIDDRVRFEINIARAESANLVLSSELLKVAFAVRRSAGPGG